MRKQEQRLWDTMHRQNKAQSHTIDLERIENVAGVGTPDLYCKFFGSQCWVELKAILAFPKRPSTRVLGDKGCNVDQINWHLKHTKFGIKSYILIRADKELFLIQGRYANEVNQWNRSELQTYSLASDWRDIFIALRH